MKCTVIDCFKTKDIYNQRLSFELPLDHSKPLNNNKISVFVNITQKYDSYIEDLDGNYDLVLPEKPKLIAYLQGGPGFPCDTPTSNSGITKVLLERNYQIVWLDQRGTGYSTPIEAKTFEQLVRKAYGSFEIDHQLKYILNFRADSIIKDLELIREYLIKKEKISILGQSFGGFSAFTYLSLYPKSIKEVLVTGGIPPIGYHVDDVYRATYKQTRERNRHYYEKYPEDHDKVYQILSYLQNNRVLLPNGSHLISERFLQLGLNFGATGGTDSIHLIVDKFHNDLKLLGSPTYSILNKVAQSLGFETNVLYALFQEAIYCDGEGMISNWSADRLRDSDVDAISKNPDFTGEMVYKFMFEDNTYTELSGFKELAHVLHSYNHWTKLYDTKVLSQITWNDVPIVAATYVNDQYVDFNLCSKVKEKYIAKGNLKQYITSEFFHNGLRADPEKVLNSLFTLLEQNDID